MKHRLVTRVYEQQINYYFKFSISVFSEIMSKLNESADKKKNQSRTYMYMYISSFQSNLSDRNTTCSSWNSAETVSLPLEYYPRTA